MVYKYSKNDDDFHVFFDTFGDQTNTPFLGQQKCSATIQNICKKHNIVVIFF